MSVALAMAQLHALKARGLVMQQQYLAMACEAAGCEPQISAAGFQDEDFLLDECGCSGAEAANVTAVAAAQNGKKRARDSESQ